MRWPFSASQTVSKVAICHAGTGSVVCTLKLIAAITKTHPLLIYFTAYILFKDTVIYSYFTFPYYCLNICFFALWTGSISILPKYLMLSSDLDLFLTFMLDVTSLLALSQQIGTPRSVAKSVVILAFYAALMTVT